MLRRPREPLGPVASWIAVMVLALPIWVLWCYLVTILWHQAQQLTTWWLSL